MLAEKGIGKICSCCFPPLNFRFFTPKNANSPRHTGKKIGKKEQYHNTQRKVQLGATLKVGFDIFEKRTIFKCMCL